MFNDKPILALETSQNLCSTCIYYSDSKFFEMNFKLKNAHAEKLFESIEHVTPSACQPKFKQRYHLRNGQLFPPCSLCGQPVKWKRYKAFR